jgi:hypothetical protein
MTTLHVVPGNNKLGRVPNVSLLPIITCDKRVGCAAQEKCYYCKFLFRENVLNSCKENTALAKRPVEFFARLREWFARKHQQPRLFRWFVGGDAPTPAFLRRLVKFSAEHPSTKFLLFTKRYHWVSDLLDTQSLPDNLSVILSAWPNWPLHNPHNLPVAWMRDPAQPDARIPSDALECYGNCEHCGMCWGLKRAKRDVVFDKH